MTGVTHAWVGRCGVGTIEAWLPSMRTQRFTWVGTARVCRLVSRGVMEDDDAKLNAINAGPATTVCMAYRQKCDTIRCRDSNKARWGALRANYV